MWARVWTCRSANSRSWWPTPWVSGARIAWDTSKPDGTPRKLLDVSRLAALGWRARIPLAEGLASTYADWLEATSRQP